MDPAKPDINNIHISDVVVSTEDRDAGNGST